MSALDERDSTGAVKTSAVVPADAKAVAFNATITATTGRGFLSVNPGDTAEAAAFKTSTLNWADPGTTRANASVVALDGGRVKLGASSSTVDVVFDVNGYYR